MREKDDIALTGATAAWTNEFCEVLLGGTILIPIAVAYLGLPDVVNRTMSGSGFDLGFHVFPTLFNKWGSFAPVAGFFWFGLLFFAAITSSLAMGQPIMAFLQEEFGLTRERSALAFGGLLLPLAIPVATLHSNTFNDEFDFWASTFMLVVFALGETILFAWIFGMNRGWDEMLKGAELKIPLIFKYIIQYVTPVFLLVILIGAVFQPKAGWHSYISAVAGNKPIPRWEWDGSSVVGKLMHLDVAQTRQAKLSGVEREIENAMLAPTSRTARLLELEQEKARLSADVDLIGYERDARILKLEHQAKDVADVGKMSEAERHAIAEELGKLSAKVDSFYSRLPAWRNFDRLVMVAVYVFFLMYLSVSPGASVRPKGELNNVVVGCNVHDSCLGCDCPEHGLLFLQAADVQSATWIGRLVGDLVQFL